MNYASEVPSQPYGNHIEIAAHKLPFLTDTELRAIAEPLRQPAAIVRWFQRQGFEVKRKPNGMPLISRTHFETIMHGIPVGSLCLPTDLAKNENIDSPNVTAFLRRFRKEMKQ